MRAKPLEWSGLIYSDDGTARKYLVRTTRFIAKEHAPKTYKRIGSVKVGRRFLMDGEYLKLYKRHGGYAVSTYVDGCFYEQFALADIVEV